MTPSGIITLLTDFGTVDGYVGAMKGVLLSEAPAARVVDLTHDIPPQDVAAGAYALETAAPWFPEGTIHVAVVDPGVGSSRRPIAVHAFGQLFLGPDNGLLSAAIGAALPRHGAAVRLLDAIPPEWPLSSTFHGRDLFARVAGRLAAGVPLDEYSNRVAADPVRLAEPSASVDGDGRRIEGRVVHIDRFGNLVTNVNVEALAGVLGEAPAGHHGAAEELAGRVLVEVAGRSAPLLRTYAEAPPEGLLAYVGSARRLEVAVRDGSAMAALGVGRGAPVVARAR